MTSAASYEQPSSDSFPIVGKLRKALQATKKDALSESLKEDATWAGKVEAEVVGVKLGKIPALLDALGFKIVTKAKVCVDRDVYEAVMTIHAKLAPRVPQLVWEDAE
jgi:hypothetical protein